MIALVLIILLVSVILHEIGHGVVALWCGDNTAQRAKRLTLNPLRHIDIVGTLVLPFLLFVTQAPILFGWAKPVPFNPSNFKHPRRGLFWVAVAGVIVNFLIAILLAILLHCYSWQPAIEQALVYGVSINLILGLFNLIPIPPLDGSKALSALLPRNIARVYLDLGKFSFVILVVLIMTGTIQRTIFPLFHKILTFLL